MRVGAFNFAGSMGTITIRCSPLAGSVIGLGQLAAVRIARWTDDARAGLGSGGVDEHGGAWHGSVVRVHDAADEVRARGRAEGGRDEEQRGEKEGQRGVHGDSANRSGERGEARSPKEVRTPEVEVRTRGVDSGGGGGRRRQSRVGLRIRLSDFDHRTSFALHTPNLELRVMRSCLSRWGVKVTGWEVATRPHAGVRLRGHG
jgi:hypothetical protein